MMNTVDGKLFCEMLIAAAASVEARKQEINELNVFPVPDGDTGTNMSMTMNAAAKELSQKRPEELTAAADLAASSMLRGARGNSGVILSLLFRGISKRFKEKKSADAAELAAAMNEGVAAAYKAVMKPTEGTILTVARLASAAAAEAAKTETELTAVLERAEAAGEAALQNTVELNPVLKKAGVVDAGGMGYMTILRAMLRVLKGEAAELPGVSAETEAGEEAGSVFAKFETADIRYPYCTEFIVSRDNDKSVDLLRSYLSSIGDSAVVLDDEELIKVHVHSACPGEVLTEALTYGALQTVKVENMRLQHTAKLEAEKPEIPEPTKPLSIVAVCAGEGLSALFREMGADQVVSGGQTMNPSTEDILKAVQRSGGKTVLVLPNNKNIIMAAQQCVGLSDRQVIVIPTTTVQQGISAMMMLEPEAEAGEIQDAMMEAVAGVHSFSVTYAARDSSFDGMEIHEGEFLVMEEGKLICNAPDKATMTAALAVALRDIRAELVSIFYGADVEQADAEKLQASLNLSLPDAEFSLVSGGQPVYYYLISAE